MDFFYGKIEEMLIFIYNENRLESKFKEKVIPPYIIQDGRHEMKRLVKILFALLLLVGCSSKSDEDNLDAVDPNTFESEENPVLQSTALFGHNFISQINGEKAEFDYNGSPIEIPYRLESGEDNEKDFTVGFDVYIDGIPQKYSVIKTNCGNEDEKLDKSYMHQFTMAKGEVCDFSFVLDPNVGKKGEVLGLYIGTVFNPDYISTKENPAFGNYHKVFFGAGTPITYHEDVSDVKKMNANTQEAMEEGKENGNGETELNNMDSLLLFIVDPQTEEVASTINAKDGVVPIKFTVQGGPTAKYRLYCKLNNEHVAIDSYENIDLHIEQNKRFTYEGEIKIPDNIKLASLEVIAIPYGDSYSGDFVFVEQSNAVLVVNK